MNIPGFNAEASLGPTMGKYQGKAVFGRFDGGSIAHAQVVLASPLLNPNLRWPYYDAVFRCCQPGFVCDVRYYRWSPFVRCKCYRTPYGPFAICYEQGPVNA